MNIYKALNRAPASDKRKSLYEYHDDKIQLCRKIINDKEIIDNNEEMTMKDDRLNTPHFIQLYEKKYGKKL